MRVRVRYFASLREALGAEELADVPAGSTVGALRDHLISLSARHAEAMRRDRAVRAALDQVMVDEAAALHEGAEIAFFPPVTGG